jgi:hypothetical protein
MSFWNSVVSAFSGSGGSSGGSSGGTNWWGVALAGLGAAASGRASDKENSKNIGRTGLEARRTTAFERETDYYYDQLKNRNKRMALDKAYHPFSTFGSWAPSGYQDPALPVVPAKPKP